MHQVMAATLEHCVLEIREIQEKARQTGKAFRPRWPVVILRSPKGWTAPREVDGHYLEGFWRAHQIPITDVAANPGHLKVLESWLRGYRPEELFDDKGRLLPELKSLTPTGTRRMSANRIANGGLLRRPLDMPDFRDCAVKVEKPGATLAGNVPTLGNFLREVARLNMGTSASSARTRRNRTDWRRSTMSPRRCGSQRTSRRTPTAAISLPKAASWRCSANTPSKVGSRATC